MLYIGTLKCRVSQHLISVLCRAPFLPGLWFDWALKCNMFPIKPCSLKLVRTLLCVCRPPASDTLAFSPLPSSRNGAVEQSYKSRFPHRPTDRRRRRRRRMAPPVESGGGSLPPNEQRVRSGVEDIQGRGKPRWHITLANLEECITVRCHSIIFPFCQFSP